MDPSSTQSVNNLETLNAFSTEFVKFDFCSADYYVLFCHNLLSNLAIDASSRMKLTYTRPGFDTALSLVFICQENPRWSGILLFPDLLRFCRLMKTQNCRYPRLSGMNRDESRKSGVFLFSRHVPDFWDMGHGIFLTYENQALRNKG